MKKILHSHLGSFRHVHCCWPGLAQAEKMDKMDNMSNRLGFERRAEGRQGPPFFFILTHSDSLRIMLI